LTILKTYSTELPPGSRDSNEVNSKIPLVVILGATAVGKTEVAIGLAEQLKGEIVSADSRLFYRGMDVGTAKPSVQERRRVPHHLIDVANPDEPWSLAIFQREANRAIQEVNGRHHLPFLVGGTGQFVRSIIEGWKIPPAHPNPRMRSILDDLERTVGAEALHHQLATLDPQAAGTIDPNNYRRTVRALEVILTTGKRFSEQRLQGRTSYRTLLIGLTRPRAELYQRIDERILKMVEGGFIDEVRGLLEAGYAPNLPTMSAIGYSEMVAYLQGKSSMEEAIILMKRRTREFVRRQANWFKENDPSIHWFRVEGYTILQIEETINLWLNTLSWPMIP
jgi:tRNA dimethylallyltransferase